MFTGFRRPEGTPQSESVSMGCSSKGIKQPVRWLVNQHDLESDTTSGHFTARLRRSNIESRDQFFQAKGTFLVKE